jgi:hypothetical protein
MEGRIMTTINTPPGIKYYDIARNWSKKIEPHLANGKVQDTLVEDLNKFTKGKWEKEFTYGQVPYDFASAVTTFEAFEWWDDWWSAHRGPMPRYLRYVLHSACHWLVNFNLELAMRAEPKRPWRIINSDHHSTVWDGRDTLFDINYFAFRIPAEECFALANEEHLQPGEHLLIGMANNMLELFEMLRVIDLPRTEEGRPA